VRRVGGVLVVDYHQRVLNDTFYPDWGRSYEHLLKNIAERNDYYCDIPHAIVKHWAERTRRIKEASIDEDSNHH